MVSGLKDEIKTAICEKLLSLCGKPVDKANCRQIYNAVAMSVRDRIMEIWAASNNRIEEQKAKKVYYLSIEYLTGRLLSSNLINLGLMDAYSEALRELGLDFEEIKDCEPDAGLGNGGLGRLAACFLDSLASVGLPAVGCGIRYELGLFRQKIVNGEQVEEPDEWLEDGNVWEIPCPADQVEVRFGGRVHEHWQPDGTLKIVHEGYSTVYAVPYDTPIIGYDSPVTGTLRLWSAKSPRNIDMDLFSRGEYARAVEETELATVISKVLYPEDKFYEGKLLRLRQQYFLCSATMQHIVREHKRQYGDLNTLPDKIAIQINDTHPALAIPELMRILMDDEGFSWDAAYSIVNAVFSYTNHTIMQEALEVWPTQMIQDTLPRIYSILNTLNRKLGEKLWEYFPGQWERIGAMSIISHNQVRMANLCVSACHMVNGVSQLHADIIKRTIFHDFYIINPDRFIGITNGITHRRWLMLANPALASLIDEAIGDAWRKKTELLDGLMAYKDDPAFLERFWAIKQGNKERLANWFSRKHGITLNTDGIFDVQAKRLHEYKRQLLNAMHILHLYHELKANPNLDIPPRVFIFGAKASPGYYRAKLIIKLINRIGMIIYRDKTVNSKLQVVFLENYGVTPAEVLIPAADISEQISTAGKEASGTGNMKFMMNGALTLGTMDGANVEIFNAVGPDNMFIFGLRADEVEKMARTGEYRASKIYETNLKVKRAVDTLIDGTLTHAVSGEFADLFHSLIFDNGDMADRYFVLRDFDSYAATQAKAGEYYRNRREFASSAVVNTAKSGRFSSDRTILEYNDVIWKLGKPLV